MVVEKQAILCSENTGSGRFGSLDGSVVKYVIFMNLP